METIADNVTVDNATNGDYTVSTDSGAGGQVQRVKLTYSADGSETHVGADADGLLVNLGANNDVTITGTVSVDDNSSTLSIDDGGGAITVDGSVTADTELTTADLDTGAGTDTKAVVGLLGSASGGGEVIPGSATDGLLVNLGSNNDVSVSNTVTVDASGAAVPITDNSGSITVDAPVGTPAFVRLSDGSSAISTLPVSLAATVTTKETRSGTGTTTQVADTATSTTVLASNANRLGASITNDSSARLYLKTGTTASTTDYSVSLAQHDSWEVPFGYTGKIDGIWATDPGDGAARVTEYTA